MSEHQFKSIYNLGYGDAMYEHRKSRKTTWPITIALILTTAIVAFWLGRVSTDNKASQPGAGTPFRPTPMGYLGKLF